MRSVGIFVDLSNIYYCVGKRYKSRKLDYEKLLKRVEMIGTIERAVAYGTQLADEATKFITYLRKLGFDVKYRTPRRTRRDEIQRVDWNVGIAVDIVRMEPHLDIVVLVSSDPQLIDVAAWVRERGKRVVVLSCGASRELREIANESREITEDLLEERIP